jgi:hypothetical protein
VLRSLIQSANNNPNAPAFKRSLNMTTTTKSGGIRKGAGRKATPIDLTELEIFCALHATDRELADRFGVSVRTIHNRRKEAEFGEVMRRGKARGCINVRNAQMKLAVAGNPAMCMWLGKNMLGQTGAPSARIAIPKIKTAADYGVAADKVLQDAARGKITAAHGKDMMNMIASHANIAASVAIISRVEKIEQKMAAAPVSGIAVVGPPGEERPKESDPEGGISKMSKENVPRRLERIETGIKEESTKFIHVGFVDGDGTPAGSFMIEVNKRGDPDPGYDSPRLLQKCIERNTVPYRQWMVRDKSCDLDRGGDGLVA